MTILHAAAAVLFVMATHGAVGEAPGSALPAAVEFFALPEAQSVAGRYGAAGASDDERLVYGNTGHSLAALLNGTFMADDLTLQAVDGCPLRRLVFHVTGKANAANAGGPFRVDWALYHNCPQAGGIVLAGDAGTPGDTSDDVRAEGFVQFATDLEGALQVVEFVAPTGSNIRLPSTTWLAVKANRQNVAITFGSPAEVGFSGDVFDFPSDVCNADAGGYPYRPHASLGAELTVESECAEAFPAYRNAHPGRAGYNEGRNECVADDIELNVASCDMVAYEVTVRGQGLYRFELRGDQGGMPGPPIEGTLKSYFVSAAAPPGSQKVHASFDPPIPMSSKMWMTGQVSTTNGGWIMTRKQAEIGATTTDYARSAAGKSCADVDDWERLPFPDFHAHGGFDVTIFCAGPPPIGACCDLLLDDPAGTGVCHQVAEVNCPMYGTTNRSYDSLGPLRRMWVAGATCESQPFEHPCGPSVCCLPDRPCQNITRAECEAIEPASTPRSWQAATFCDSEWLHCPVGECMVARGGPSCIFRDCAEVVCDNDRWCCGVEWDAMCVRAAEVECEDRAPNAVCAGTFPGDGAIALADGTSFLLSSVRGGEYTKGRPGFSCHRDGPDEWVEGITWYRWVAEETSARFHTCGSLAPAQDTTLAIYEPQDASSQAAECDTLYELACNEDSAGCNGGVGSDLCVQGLEVGRTYYVQVATHSEDELGLVQVDAETPCEGGVASALLTETGLPRGPEARSEARRSAGDASTERENLEPPIILERFDESAVRIPRGTLATAPPAHVERNGHVSVQVNVDEFGNNIVGDAANEPSLAIAPNFPNRIVIGWRQFDTIASSFRQAGWGYSHDYGKTWTFPGVLEPDVFRSDPVLDSDADGNFYYCSMNASFDSLLFKSTDAGLTWTPNQETFDGDKPWMVVDKTMGPGRGHIYAGAGYFQRSVDGGLTFGPGSVDVASWSTYAISPLGQVYAAGGTSAIYVTRSDQATFAEGGATFPDSVRVDLGGEIRHSTAPNPGGLLGQTWVAVDQSFSSSRGHVYVLASVVPEDTNLDAADVMFARSEDEGLTWSPPVRVNDDPIDNGAYQWFGTMCVAPNGRIDAFWNDTRNWISPIRSELYYAYSWDGGGTWSPNEPISPQFDSTLGWPQQQKIGDYYHCVSDNAGVSIAYAATFNGEEDVYFLRIGPVGDCNENGVPDLEEVELPSTKNCDADGIPDDCEIDFDGDGLVDDDCDDDVDGDGVANANDRCLYTQGPVPVGADGAPRNDTSGDCRITLPDYWRFRNCMMDGRAGAPAPLAACLGAFDNSGDGRVLLDDFAVFQNSYTGAR